MSARSAAGIPGFVLMFSSVFRFECPELALHFCEPPVRLEDEVADHQDAVAHHMLEVVVLAIHDFSSGPHFPEAEIGPWIV